jgi:transposase-like protein
MSSRSTQTTEDAAMLLKHLLAIELWRGGLSQAQIRTRLGLNMNLVNRMLKGVRRHVETRSGTEAA